jgi:hypothetical protein
MWLLNSDCDKSLLMSSNAAYRVSMKIKKRFEYVFLWNQYWLIENKREKIQITTFSHLTKCYKCDIIFFFEFNS